MSGTSFTVEEFTKLAQRVAQEVANNSENGRVEITEFISLLSRFNNHEESKKFQQALNRDSQGRLLETKKAL